MLAFSSGGTPFPQFSIRTTHLAGGDASTPTSRDFNSLALAASPITEPTISDRERHSLVSDIAGTPRLLRTELTGDAHRTLTARRKTGRGRAGRMGTDATAHTQTHSRNGTRVRDLPNWGRKWRAALEIRSTNSVEQPAVVIQARGGVPNSDDPYANTYKRHSHENAVLNS